MLLPLLQDNLLTSGARLIAVDSGSYTISGSTVSLKHAELLSVNAGSYAISGSTVNLVKSGGLIALSGSYSMTGATVALKQTRLLGANAGSYALTGSSVNLVLDISGLVTNNYLFTSESHFG